MSQDKYYNLRRYLAHRKQMCDRKRALLREDAIWKATLRGMGYYHCPYCKLYHLTKQSSSQDKGNEKVK